MCLESIEILQLWRITAAGCLNQRVNLIPRLAPFLNPLHGVASPKNGTMKTTMAIWCYMYWMYCLSHDLTETDKKNLNCHSNPWKFGRSSQVNKLTAEAETCFRRSRPLSDGTGSLCGTVMTIGLSPWGMSWPQWFDWADFVTKTQVQIQEITSFVILFELFAVHHFYHVHSCYFMFIHFPSCWSYWWQIPSGCG